MWSKFLLYTIAIMIFFPFIFFAIFITFPLLILYLDLRTCNLLAIGNGRNVDVYIRCGYHDIFYVGGENCTATALEIAGTMKSE